ncbi:MAG: hypothetical protein SFU56_01210 [Capsulimonadales bacterium]|nr:hypothetical protein [Capsulimonadales bacterium]
MSRRVCEPVTVDCFPNGEPYRVRFAGAGAYCTVLAIREHWREWLGALDGEPERDIWQVELPQGVCELHCLRDPLAPPPIPEYWLLDRWED